MTWRPKRGFRVGRMRERITIQRRDATVTDGQPVNTYTTALYTDEPASYEPVSGGETIRGRQVESNIAAIFTIHTPAVTAVSPLDKVILGSASFFIVAVMPVDGSPRYTELHCRAKNLTS